MPSDCQHTADSRHYAGISGFYFCLCIILGAVYPYLSVYLEARAWPYPLIGLSGTLIFVASMTAPILFTELVRRSGRRAHALVAAGLMLAAVMAVGLNLSQWPGLFCSLLFSCCAILFGCIPYVEASGISVLRRRRGGYGQARLWGSIGFVTSVVFCGRWLQANDFQALPWLIAVGFAVCTMSVLLLPSSDQKLSFIDEVSPEKKEEKTTCSPSLSPPLSLLLPLALVFFLLNISHGPYYTFYSIYLGHSHYDESSIALLWAVAIVAEVLVFAWGRVLLQQFTTVIFLAMAIGLSVLRWLLMALWVDQPGWQVLAQCLHGLSFAAVHLCALELIHQGLPQSQHSRAIAVYSSLCVAGGSAVGTHIAGYFIGDHGQWVFFGAAASAALALPLLLITMSRQKNHSRRLRRGRTFPLH